MLGREIFQKGGSMQVSKQCTEQMKSCAGWAEQLSYFCILQCSVSFVFDFLITVSDLVIYNLHMEHIIPFLSYSICLVLPPMPESWLLRCFDFTPTLLGSCHRWTDTVIPFLPVPLIALAMILGWSKHGISPLEKKVYKDFILFSVRYLPICKL